MRMEAMPPARSGTPASGGTRRVALWLWFGLWCTVSSLLGAWMVAQHELALPAPQGVRQKLEPAQEGVRGPALFARHYLAVDCGCSKGLAKTLVERGPRAAPWREEVVLIGRAQQLAAQLSAAGYSVRSVENEEALKEDGVEGAPWLLLYSASGDLAYSGGYAKGRPGTTGTVLEDLSLMSAVERGEHPGALPAYGCATSRELRRRLDPFGLKYTP